MAEHDLAGATIALTAERRVEEFATLLERRGAEIVRTPVIHVLPLVDDRDLRTQTSALIADPPELVVISTGIGFRGWLDAVASWGLTEEFLGALAHTRIIARGPKATGAIRGAGLREEWSPSGESSEEVLAHLGSEGVAGLRIAVQLHGTITEWEPLTDLSASLADIRRGCHSGIGLSVDPAAGSVAGPRVGRCSSFRCDRRADLHQCPRGLLDAQHGKRNGRAGAVRRSDARTGTDLLRRTGDGRSAGTPRCSDHPARAIASRFAGEAHHRRPAHTSPPPGVTASINSHAFSAGRSITS